MVTKKKATVKKKTTTKKKAPVKKTTAKKKAAVKKAPVKKKAPAKKTTAKKTLTKKAPAKKTVAKKAPVKKTVAKKSPARKPTKRKKPIGFTMMVSYQRQIEKAYETMQKLFDDCGTLLTEYIYDGKKKNAALSRAQLMTITKESKNLRNIIQEAKTKLKPVYKTTK